MGCPDINAAISPQLHPDTATDILRQIVPGKAGKVVIDPLTTARYTSAPPRRIYAWDRPHLTTNDRDRCSLSPAAPAGSYTDAKKYAPRVVVTEHSNALQLSDSYSDSASIRATTTHLVLKLFYHSCKDSCKPEISTKT